MAEKEYIERGALLNAVMESKKNNPHSNGLHRQMHTHEHNHFLCMLEIAPAADVVEVIRCKECIHYAKSQREGYIGGLCMFTHSGVFELDFCSRGERKDQDNG